MSPKWKKWTMLLSGWTFVFLGVLGLFLPVLQGILFLMIGLIILSTEYVWAHKLLGKLKGRFPKLAAAFEEASEKARAWMGHPR
jgi:uncharacterized membrane protein YbaN (DUF454 family)